MIQASTEPTHLKTFRDKYPAVLKSVAALILFLSFSSVGLSQVVVPRSPVAVAPQDAYEYVTFGLKLPNFADTAHANAMIGHDSTGFIFYNLFDSSVYVRDIGFGHHRWKQIGTGGAGAVSDVFGRIGHVTAVAGDYSSFYPLLSGSYSDPTWINTLSASKITGYGALTAGSSKIGITGAASSALLTNVTIDVNQGNLNLASIGGLLGIGQINATGSPSSTTFLRGDGTWSTAGSGGGTYTADETSIHLASTVFGIKSTWPGQTSLVTVGALSAGSLATGFTPVTNALLANSTISGVSLGSNLFNLTLGNGLTPGGVYNGSAAISAQVDSSKFVTLYHFNNFFSGPSQYMYVLPIPNSPSVITQTWSDSSIKTFYIKSWAQFTNSQGITATIRTQNDSSLIADIAVPLASASNDGLQSKGDKARSDSLIQFVNATGTGDTLAYNIPGNPDSIVTRRILVHSTDGTVTITKTASTLKQIDYDLHASGSAISALTGDVTASGAGSVTATLATVNSNIGTFGDATHVMQQTVNAKGLTTAASNVSIQIAESQVTNLTSDLALKAPLASPTFTGVPAAPTASPGTNTTQVASTAFVTAAVAAGGGVASTFDTTINVPNTANYTIPSTTKNIFLQLADLTGQANRTLTYPSMAGGQTIKIKNNNTPASTFSWSVSGGTIKDFGNNTISILPNQTVVVTEGDGTNWDIE